MAFAAKGDFALSNHLVQKMGINDAAAELERTLFKRCVKCPDTQPSCPSCPSGQVCSLIPPSCDQCARTTCVKSSVGGGSSGPNVGAIAGGVIGGVIFIAIATFLVWRFCIRPRRQRYEEAWEEEDDVATQKHAQFNELRDQRASVHTVHSMASTILSRASNVIPIAFIPGVTNRDGSNAPPVPPIPAARADGAIFFKPGDIRGSAYSDASSIDNRSTFFGRPSITPSLARSSVGDIYRGDAVVNPMPAQTVLRGKANMVSVKSSQTNSPTEGTTGTATPINIFERDFGNANDKGKKPAVMMPSSSDNTGSPSPAGSIRSGASFVKPNIVSVGTKNNKKGRFPIARTASDGSTATASTTKPVVSSPLANAGDESSDDEDEPHARARKSLLNQRNANSPFVGGLSSVIEEATRRASRVPSHTGLGGKGDQSPFSDAHAAD